jgi:hypothetical protein
MWLMTPLALRIPPHARELQSECLDALKDIMQARLVAGSG